MSEECYTGNAIFAYSLSPAATWKGTIGKGKVVINIVHPEPWDVSIQKPKQRFARINETRYEWDFENLKPTLEDDIKIAAHSGFGSFPVNYAAGMSKSKLGGCYIIDGDRYYLVHSDYVRNVREGNATKHARAEGVDDGGIGESVTLNVKRPLPLDAILITPGYGAPPTPRVGYGSDEQRPQQEPLWWKNNRVAQLEITLNDEYTFTAAFPDEIFHDPYPVPVRGYSKPVEKIKMVIKAIHRGTQVQDHSLVELISSVGLRAKLTKEPKMGPCR
jgi:hypothetical protein